MESRGPSDDGWQELKGLGIFADLALADLKDLFALCEERVLSDRPIAVTYEITDFGRSALGILDQLQLWAEEHDI